MKPHSSQAIGITALGLLTATLWVLPAQAVPQPNDRFFCGKSRNPVTGDMIPTTIARTQRGNVLMIHWRSTFFANSLNDFTPESRCLEVSRRFQTFYSQGNLSYLTTGKINDQNVICVAQEYGGSCKGLLLTLEPKDDSQAVLRDLMDVRVNARGPITRGAASTTYIDVEDFLDNAPVQTEPISVYPDEKISPAN
jgi:Circadian oscillating protein COP23